MSDCEHTSTGCPDCQDRNCRTRWLAGSTTGEPYQPAPLRSLIVDILETWHGHWFTERELAADVQHIRPRMPAGTVDRVAERVRKAGGAEVGGIWVTVQARQIELPADPLFTSTGSLGWELRVEQRSL